MRGIPNKGRAAPDGSGCGGHWRGNDALAGKVELRWDAFMYAALRFDRIESLRIHRVKLYFIFLR